MDRDIELLLDFRHFDGSNSYLVKFRGSRLVEWVDEDQITGFDEQMFQLRREKGEFAKRRVFGDRSKGVRGGIRLRKIESSEKVSESDSTTSDDSGDDLLVLPTQLKTTADSLGNAGDRVEFLKSGLSVPESEISDILSRLAALIGPTSLGDIGHVFLDVDNDAKTNKFFGTLIKNESIDTNHRIIMELLWALVITSPCDSNQRDEALQHLCLVANELPDALISRQFTEFVSKTTEKVSELSDSSFKCLSRLCDLMIEIRLKAPNVSDRARPAVHDDPILVNSVLVKTFAAKQYVAPTFSYVLPGQTELDDDGIINLVYKIYKWKNSEKLADVPGIIEKYKTQLSNLFSTLMKKYSVSYPELNDSRVFIPIEEKKRILKSKLSEIFLFYEPSKLVDIDAICAYWLDKPTTDTAKYIASLESRYAGIHGGRSQKNLSRNLVYSKSVKEFKSLITEALSIGNPDLVGSVDSLLAKYRGREEHLYLGICDKYGLSVNEVGFNRAQSFAKLEQDEIRSVKMRTVLERIYAEHNPSKINEVDKLVSKYNIAELFDLIVKKYKIDLATKIEFLIEIGYGDNVIDKLSENELIVTSLKAIAVCVELERISPQGLILTGTPSSFLTCLLNPLFGGYAIESIETVIRGRPVGAAGEDQLRDQIESKLDSISRRLSMRDCPKSITAGEPDYANWSTSFRVTEHARSHCVVSMRGDASNISSLISSLVELLDQQADTTMNIPPVAGIEAGAGSFRAHTVLTAPGNVTMFIGDFRSMISQPETNMAPNLYRCRFSLWASVDAEKCRKLVKICLQWPKWLTQCSVFIDEHSRTVAVVGSLRHRVAFKQASRVMSIVLGEESYIALTVPKRLCKDGNPTAILPPQIHEWSDASFHESGDDIGQVFSQTESENENEPSSETFRPLRLTRRKMRDSYLQGQLCLNCDAITHKPTECVLKRKVCWNCHGAHAGSACMFPCRFCKGKHAWGILECVKKGAKRFAEWLRSRSNVEEKGLSGMVGEVLSKLETNDWNINDPAISGTYKNLLTLGIDFDLVNRGDEFDQLEFADGRPTVTGSGSLVGESISANPPTESPPPLPDSRFKWTERLFLDDILSTQALLGRDAMRLIMSQKGSQIKQLEAKENCKILFRGAIARDIFASDNSSGIVPEVDTRFHAIILCDSSAQALGIRKALIDMVRQVEDAVVEGSIPNVPIVEAFRYLEKVDEKSRDSLYQYDYLNTVHEMDLGERFEYVGDLRHWLHQKGIQVELGDDAAVRLPGTSTICKAIDPQIEVVDTEHVEVYNMFKSLLDNWIGLPPSRVDQYWFEPFELDPVGMLSLTSNVAGEENQFELGQVVRLSDYAVAKFADILVFSNLVEEIDNEKISQVLSRVRGVVRINAENVRLLMYLKHPWALSTSSGSVGRDVPEDFDSAAGHLKNSLNPHKLRECGRIGVLHGDILSMSPEQIKQSVSDFEAEDLVPGCTLTKRLESVPECELPYVGYIVDWMMPEEISEFLEIRAFGDQSHFHEPISPRIEPIESPKMVESQLVADEPTEVDKGEDLLSFSVAELKDMLKDKNLPVTGRKADLIERLVADRRRPIIEPISLDVSPRNVAPMISGKNLRCRFELPKALMKWSELLHNLTGPNNSHFAHINQQCPSATVICLGSASAALVGDARLHVQLTATESADFIQAKSLVEDLVRAVVEVGIDVCLGDEPEATKSATAKDIKIVDI